MPAAAPEPPLGVILHVRRGELAIPCEVRRAPELDRRGETAWIAVPVDPVTLRPDDEPGRDYSLKPTILPDGAVLILPSEDYTKGTPADILGWPPDVW